MVGGNPELQLSTATGLAPVLLCLIIGWVVWDPWPLAQCQGLLLHIRSTISTFSFSSTSTFHVILTSMQNLMLQLAFAECTQNCCCIIVH